VSVYLDGPQVRLDEWNVASFLEEVDGAGMIHARRQYQQEVVEQQWLVVEVELQRAVVDLNVSHLRDDVFEVTLLPRVRRVVHHRYDRVVVLLVFVVQEHQLRPQVRLVGGAQHLNTERHRQCCYRRCYYNADNMQLSVSAYCCQRHTAELSPTLQAQPNSDKLKSTE